MHKVKPHQRVRILSIDLAVDANVDDGNVADEISVLLSENGVTNPSSSILDWKYKPDTERIVMAPQDDIEEGEIFFAGIDVPTAVCRSALQVLDGSQLIDVPGAVMVLQYALGLLPDA